MTTRVLTSLQDDIDGSDATQTIRFALDGIEYEIDVSDRNANRLRNSLGDFIAHGRKVGSRRARKSASSGRLIPRPSGSGPKPMALTSIAVDASRLK